MISFYNQFFPLDLSNFSPLANRNSEKDQLIHEHLHLYYSQQVYDYGTECLTKPGLFRKTVVYFDCGSDNSISEVKEYEVGLFLVSVRFVLFFLSFVRFVNMK
jgi:hypothetical protein